MCIHACICNTKHKRVKLSVLKKLHTVSSQKVLQFTSMRKKLCVDVFKCLLVYHSAWTFLWEKKVNYVFSLLEKLTRTVHPEIMFVHYNVWLHSWNHGRGSAALICWSWWWPPVDQDLLACDTPSSFPAHHLFYLQGREKERVRKRYNHHTESCQDYNNPSLITDSLETQ